MKYFILMLISIFIIGCEESEKPKLLHQKSTTEYAKKIVSTYEKKDKEDFKIKKEIALIQMKKEVEKEKIKAQKELQIAKIQKDKELEKNRLNYETKKEENSIKKIALITLSLISFVFLIVLYFIFKNHQKTKIAIEKEKIKAQKEIKEKELKAQMATKLIDAMTSGKLSKEQEERLLSLAQGKNIIEYKKD